MIATLRAAVARSVAELSDLDAEALVLARRNRFRAFGANAISRHWADEAVR
jgi:acetyl-CoA carboxylase alpha subunit